MWRERIHRREDGAGLVVALLATLIISGMVVVFMTRTLTETRLSSSSRDREAAVHVAEGGVDDVLVDVAASDTFVTTEPGGAEHVIDLSVHDTLEKEKAWAVGIAVAESPTRCTVVAVETGEACGIRPRSSGGALLPWIYGVGFVPDRDNAEKVRVIKVQYDKGFFAPANAILTNGNLTFNGQVCGASANVHSNGDVSVGGNGDTVSCADPDGQVTASGSYSPGGTVGADSGHVDRTEEIPIISALNVYRKEAAREAARDSWYDLCPDGTIHVPLLDASGDLALDASGDPQICTATTELYDSSEAATFMGWQFQSSQNTWDVTTSNVPNGVFYIHHADAKIRGDLPVDTNMTVLVDGVGDIDGQPDTGSGCLQAGGNNGNLRFAGIGGGNYNPYLQDLLFLADRDIVGQGNSSVTINGVLLAHEQIDFGGTVTFTGAVVAEGACDSTGSPVSMGANRVTGNFEITYNDGKATPLDSAVPRITAWNEL